MLLGEWKKLMNHAVHHKEISNSSNKKYGDITTAT
jgi:hypothetical protein